MTICRQARESVHKIPFNPIALRKAKIAYNSGLSECNRVKLLLNLHDCIITWPSSDSGAVQTLTWT